MELPKNEEVFEIDALGETTYKKYEGQFTVRCVLNMGQKHAMELEKSRLMGSLGSPTEALAGIAIIFATLRAKVIEGPEWWKQSAGGSNIKDENVLVELFNRVEKAEVEWREKVKKLAQPEPTTDSQSQTP